MRRAGEHSGQERAGQEPVSWVGQLGSLPGRRVPGSRAEERVTSRENTVKMGNEVEKCLTFLSSKKLSFAKRI